MTKVAGAVRGNRLGFVAAGLSGAGLYLLRFGTAHLDPANIHWLLSGFDQAMCFLGWDFFRHEPWHWPPGLIAGYCAPQGTSIGLVDALPILGLPLKALSPLLPEHCQYFGVWTLVNYILQAVVAYALLGAATLRAAARLLGAWLFLLVPPFLLRHGHIALASHWLVLASLLLYFRGSRRSCFSLVAPWVGLTTLAAGIHVYLTFMVAGIGTAALLRSRVSDRSCNWGAPAAGLAGMAAGAAAVWLIAGNFFGGSLAVQGNYGIYSANLNTLINPSEMGGLLPRLPTWGQGQYEGFNYLGGGVLLLAVVALGVGLGARPARFPARHLWLALVLAGLAVFAVSDHVAWGDRLLLEVNLPTPLQRFADAFRASGRFLWPAVYLLLFLVVRTVARRLPRRLSVCLLAVALAVQIVDLWPHLRMAAAFRRLRYESRLVHSGWERAASRAAAIRVVPSCQVSNGNHGDFKDFAWLARRAGIPVTAGYDAGRLAASCIYVLRPCDLPRFWAGAPESLTADVWDGYCVLYPRAAWPEGRGPYASARRVELGRYLSERTGCLLLLAVMDEATTGLSAADRAVLRQMGSGIDRLGYRHAYLGVAAGGRILLERFGSDAAVELDLGPEIAWPGLPRDPPIHLRSAGFAQGNEARILIGGRDFAFGVRGINTVAIDSLGRPIEVGSFDTYRGGPGLVAGLSLTGPPGAGGASGAAATP